MKLFVHYTLTSFKSCEHLHTRLMNLYEAFFVPVLHPDPVQLAGQSQWFGLVHVPPLEQDGLHIAKLLIIAYHM